MNEYEMEMQEQAEYMSRWKLRKEIKKKLRALRKKVKADEASLPQLQIIDKDLAVLVNPRTLEALRILEEKGKNIPAPKNPELKLNSYKDLNIHITHTHVQSYKARYMFAKYPLPHLEEFGEAFGRQLMQEGLIKVKIYDDSENTGVVEMQIDVVVDDK